MGVLEEAVVRAGCGGRYRRTADGEWSGGGGGFRLHEVPFKLLEAHRHCASM